MEDKLDWVQAERNLYEQEVAALKRDRNGTPRAQDIVHKYKELVERHGALVNRLRKIKEQRAVDRATWKLQLEAALADVQRLEADKQRLEDVIDNEVTIEEVQQLVMEKKQLEDALVQEGKSHAKEVRELKASLMQAESEMKLTQTEIEKRQAQE